MIRMLLAAAAGFALAAPSAAATFTFSYDDAVNIPDRSGIEASVEVSGLIGNVTDVSITLLGLSHTYPDDLAVGLYSWASNGG